MSKMTEEILKKFEDRKTETQARKVFLGGTCNNSQWREALIPLLTLNYFDPVVKDWTPECMEEEIKQRQECDFCLYVITPLMIGSYSIAEAVDDSHKRSDRIIFVVLEKEENVTFSVAQLKSLYEVGAMIVRNGGFFFKNLQATATFLNVYDPDAQPKKPPVGSPRIADLGIDGILVSGMNVIKTMELTRQTALALTKVEEALHWLGFKVNIPLPPKPKKEEIKEDETSKKDPA